MSLSPCHPRYSDRTHTQPHCPSSIHPAIHSKPNYHPTPKEPNSIPCFSSAIHPSTIIPHPSFPNRPPTRSSTAHPSVPTAKTNTSPCPHATLPRNIFLINDKTEQNRPKQNKFCHQSHHTKHSPNGPMERPSARRRNQKKKGEKETEKSLSKPSQTNTFVPL